MSASKPTVLPDRPRSAQATATGTVASRRIKLRTPLNAHGEPMLWLTGGSLVICVLMVVALLLFVLWMGLITFWPVPVRQVQLFDGRTIMGEVTRSDVYEPDPTILEGKAEAYETRAREEMAAHEGELRRRLFRTGNFELTNTHFTWVNDAEIEPGSERRPDWALVLERNEWGRFYGTPVEFRVDDEVVATEPTEVWASYQEHHERVRDRWETRRKLERHDLGELHRETERARQRVREVQIENGLSSAWARLYRDRFELRQALEAAGGSDSDIEGQLERTSRLLERLEANAGRPSQDAVEAYRLSLLDAHRANEETELRSAEIVEEIRELNEANERYVLVAETADGRRQEIPLDQIVRAYPANQLSFMDKLGVYLSRWWEFLADEPREANSEGGVFPAIVGTVLMTLIMAILVVPFGVMAALYLREYAKAGPIVSAVRIAINNLAGVPSIVFGVFGLGFFCYGVGAFIDGGPSYALPRTEWFVLLGGLAVASVAAFASMVMGMTKPGEPVRGFKKSVRYVSGTMWLGSAIIGLVLIATTPFFDGFFQASLPNPTFGKGALIWASFTLALLTLPVVIVATEEALSAVPNSMREGSYACGASKWQTIKRIVLPRALPGIMTGTILAMARGAGEVAPLMLVGAVKLAPELPISASPGEHFGVNRSFMHLGFHIYDLGFQSQNSEAAKPLVFTTTLLLIAIVASLNLAAIWLRSRLRRKFVGVQF